MGLAEQTGLSQEDSVSSDTDEGEQAAAWGMEKETGDGPGPSGGQTEEEITWEFAQRELAMAAGQSERVLVLGSRLLEASGDRAAGTVLPLMRRALDEAAGLSPEAQDGIAAQLADRSAQLAAASCSCSATA